MPKQINEVSFIESLTSQLNFGIRCSDSTIPHCRSTNKDIYLYEFGVIERDIYGTYLLVGVVCLNHIVGARVVLVIRSFPATVVGVVAVLGHPR